MRSPATGLTDHERGICFRATVRMFPAASRIARLTGAGTSRAAARISARLTSIAPSRPSNFFANDEQRAIAAAAHAADDVRHRSLDVRIARGRAAEERRDGRAVGVAAEDANRAVCCSWHESASIRGRSC